MMSGQYGTAPNNYYPNNYGGSTFTGTVTEAKDNQITLTFTKGSKTDRFTGLFETGCSVPSKNSGRMMPTDIPTGTVMTVFYNGTSKKVNGRKIRENLIVAIAFDVWQGQRIAEDKKMIYSCNKSARLQFKAFQ